MYTLSQINQHVQNPQLGDVWIHRETHRELVVSSATAIDNLWRRSIARNYHAKFLVNENIKSPVLGETYTNPDGEIIYTLGENNDGEILIGWNRNWGDECIPDEGYREQVISQEKWAFIVSSYNFELASQVSEVGEPSKRDEIKSGWFDVTKNGLKFRYAFVQSDCFICAYEEGKSRKLFDSTEEFNCWLNSLAHSKVREFGDYPEKDNFTMENAYGQRFQVSYHNQIVYKNGERFADNFVNEDDFSCWLHSMRQV